MRSLGLIIRRELACYVHTPLGVIVGACVLLADGLLFNAFALGSGRRFSSEVLEDFFYFSSGTTVIAALFLAMRLLAEERQRGTISLLFSSPVNEWQIVLGKFFSAQLFLSLLTLATLYMPALIFVNGRVSLGHIAAGYLGLLLLGAAALAMGTFASAVARTPRARASDRSSRSSVACCSGAGSRSASRSCPQGSRGPGSRRRRRASRLRSARSATSVRTRCPLQSCRRWC